MVTFEPALFVPEEADVRARVAGMDIDHAAMAAASNIWRAAQAMRTHLERRVLRDDDLSWAGFSLLFNLWVWGAMETRALAASMGVTRATVDRVVYLGFEVRVELTSATTGAPFTAQITRGDAEALRLNEGDDVYVRATRLPPVAGALQTAPPADAIPAPAGQQN